VKEEVSFYTKMTSREHKIKIKAEKEAQNHRKLATTNW